MPCSETRLLTEALLARLAERPKTGFRGSEGGMSAAIREDRWCTSGALLDHRPSSWPVSAAGWRRGAPRAILGDAGRRARCAPKVARGPAEPPPPPPPGAMCRESAVSIACLMRASLPPCVVPGRRKVGADRFSRRGVEGRPWRAGILSRMWRMCDVADWRRGTRGGHILLAGIYVAGGPPAAAAGAAVVFAKALAYAVGIAVGEWFDLIGTLLGPRLL